MVGDLLLCSPPQVESFLSADIQLAAGTPAFNVASHDFSTYFDPGFNHCLLAACPEPRLSAQPVDNLRFFLFIFLLSILCKYDTGDKLNINHLWARTTLEAWGISVRGTKIWSGLSKGLKRCSSLSC